MLARHQNAYEQSGGRRDGNALEWMLADSPLRIPSRPLQFTVQPFLKIVQLRANLSDSFPCAFDGIAPAAIRCVSQRPAIKAAAASIVALQANSTTANHKL